MRLAWLTARPIAHRGLHDAAAGTVENTAGAFAAAVATNYGIECDLQVSADGEAMVHHDDALGRLTEGSGHLAEMSAAMLKAVRFKASGDRMLTLSELCELIAGRVTLLLELKSRFDGDTRLAQRAGAVLRDYAGPVAAMSFDPDALAALREFAPSLTRGVVAQRHYPQAEWPALPRRRAFVMAHLLRWPRTRPAFVAYAVRDLPAAAPLIARSVFGVPLLTWTVRSEDDRQRAERYADQMIFEGWRP
jgi:glycerophosphoryl diester phosphodiesterase